MLDNISVKQSDLENIHPGVADMLYDNQISFDDVITRAKKKVYQHVKEHYKNDDENRYLNNSEMDSALDKVKDLPKEEYLKERISKLAIAEIFLVNDDTENYQLWKMEALEVPMFYYIDSDGDNTADYGELRKTRILPRLSR